MASIQLEHVEKRFGDDVAVRDLSLDIADGELLVVVGPSGSGKSTVLRLIAGLEAPTAGRIRIGGVDVTDTPPQARDLAMVFQHYALYPHMSVRDNLAFGLRMRNVAAETIARRIEDVARSLGLTPLLDRRPGQLSGGERQRVAFGRAVVREPRAFLLDEPLSNLDPRLRGSTRAELALLHQRLGATMVYVTHDQEEAMTLGTRVAVMRDGAIEQVAPPTEVYRRPANCFVAQFVGNPAMNLLPGASWRMAAPQGLETPRSGLTVGIRPQDIALVGPDEGDTAGRVELIEPLGGTALAHVRVDGLPRQLVRVLLADDADIAVGARVGLRPRRDRLHFFNGSSGCRITATDESDGHGSD
ncbi:MAG: ABC transporter ATP-binding protein [Acidobacteria bacterium]|nr:ABC transporter ATP-binding protein [Acidobacteriota bacterium]